MKKIKKPKKKLTKSQLNKLRKDTNACEHDKVGYAALMKLSDACYVRSKKDAEEMTKIVGVLDWQKDHINSLKKMNEMLVDRHEDQIEELEKQIEELTLQRNEGIRAYNGLAQMGKFAEDMGIDLQSAKDDLPEAEKNKYDFKQTDKVLESGKVSTTIHLKRKKGSNEIIE